MSKANEIETMTKIRQMNQYNASNEYLYSLETPMLCQWIF